MAKPFWIFRPSGTMTDPDLAAAYKARTLHLVVTVFATHVGYSFAADADRAAKAVAQPKNVHGVTIRKYAEPYPFGREAEREAAGW